MLFFAGILTDTTHIKQNNVMHFILFYLFFIEVQLIYNVVLVSGVRQSDSDIYIYIYIYIYMFLQNIEYCSLCYMIGPCWLSIFYIVVCIC